MTLDDVHDKIIESLDASAAHSVLDIGCGKGQDLLRIARLAPHSARLVGIDSSDEAVKAARAATKGDPRFSLLVHDVSSGLPFPDEEFDRVLSINLLECIPDKQQFLQEVRRVLTPTGRVVFAHWDWDSQLIDGDDKALVRRIVHEFGDLKQAWMADVDPWMGRRLWRTFQASGLFDGTVEPYVVTSTRFEPGTYDWETIESFRTLVRRGLLREEEYESFRGAIDGLAAVNQYFYSVTKFVYVGTPIARSSAVGLEAGEA